MNTALPETRQGRIVAVIPYVVTAIVFAAAYGQAQLYYSNQNQYFLHGLALAGEGHLNEDWLAGTLDPTPVFSGLVAATVRFLHPWLFHAYNAVLMGAYAAALLGVFALFTDAETFRRRWPVYAAVLVLVHSAAIRWCSYRLFGHDYPWFLQAGVAGQYALGGMFQPSMFGVLVIVGLVLFGSGRPYLAAAALALGATVHPTYLLSAALLTLGFSVALVKEGRPGRAIGVGALTFVLVAPAAVYSAIVFQPSSVAEFTEAQEILVNVRIPHHSRPDLWLDEVAVIQIGWMMLGIALTWGSRLFLPMAVSFVLGTLLTLAQVWTGSNTLALLFPWRVSAVLMPVATAVVLSRLMAIRALPLDGGAVRIVSLALMALLAVVGAWISLDRLAFYQAEEELPVMAFVARTKQPGDVFFLPVRVPELAKTTRGSLSSDFKPLPDKRQDTRVIPVDLQRFRLHTGAAIFVDFKSIPYKDVEVIDWRDRLRAAENMQEQLRQGQQAEALDELRRRGVTHIVLPASQSLSGLEPLYEDDSYRVYGIATRH